ncbi:hypothetical protein ABTX60_07140 [Streptomyces sp. NPDC126510]|uniref:hypothetical protein n=1 Tax=Streptomyces sp. NPDC126510 TaxID=3155317 RepID=UPI003316C9D2
MSAGLAPEAPPRELDPGDLDAFFESVREDGVRGLSPIVKFAWRFTHPEGQTVSRPAEDQPSEAT